MKRIRILLQNSHIDVSHIKTVTELDELNRVEGDILVVNPEGLSYALVGGQTYYARVNGTARIVSPEIKYLNKSGTPIIENKGIQPPKTIYNEDVNNGMVYVFVHKLQE